MAERPAKRRLRWAVGGAVVIVGLLALGYALLPADRQQAGTGRGFVDMHVHTAGIGAGGSGAFVNKAMRENFRFPLYLRAFGVSRAELEAEGDALVIARISAAVAASQRVDKAVVLALDGVVQDGELDRAATQVYVPNDFVAAETAKHPNLCFGASINPYRRDAVARLRRARRQGAVLLKWIPNIMAINPADEAIRPFYKALVDLNLPLLSHAGQERSFASAQDELGDPRRLELPLRLGVTVIAAHIASTGTSEGEDNFQRILPMFARHANLYSEVSSLTAVNKLGYLERALATPGLPERLLYGTDWPLQFFPMVSPFYQSPRIGLRQAKSIAAIDNAWDRDVALKEAMGVPRQVFERTAELLAVERCGAGAGVEVRAE